MTESIEVSRPKLRTVDVHFIVRDDQPEVLLQDPLRLSESMIVIPQQLAPILSLCDGTRDADGLRAALLLHFGLRVGADVVEHVVSALDEAFLLENERFAQARDRALNEYREAPFRPSTLAGESYPADADELRRLLDGYLEAVGDVDEGATVGRGLVCPHIDYARGGPVYAGVWKRAAEMAREAEVAVILGTDHYGEAGRLTLTRQRYATPLGTLPTAVDEVDRLAETLGEEAFVDELNHRSEHSVELAAVWLQHLRKGEPCQLVPVLCGSFAHFVQGEGDPRQDARMAAFVDALREMMTRRRTVIVAAADLSHVGPAFGGELQGRAERVRVRAADDELMQRICAGDAEGFYAAIEEVGGRYNVCGLPPIYLTLQVLSPVRGERVAYEQCPADQEDASLVSICGILLE